MNFSRRFALAAALLALSVAPGRAELQVIGDGLSGDVAVADGTTLWSLIQNVQTPIAPGDNGKNAILHNYVVVQGADGAKSVFSAGELDPSFGGTNTAPYFAVSGGETTLVDPNTGASVRGLSDVTSVTVVAAPALPTGAGGASTSVALSGLVTNPMSYTATDLGLFPPASATADGSVYDGTSLYGFIDPNTTSELQDIVITGATDGYLVVFSLAELDPSLGGNSENLLATSGATFPGSAVARLVLPDDNKHGRWVSNIDFIKVGAVPEAPAWSLLAIGFAGLALTARRARRALRAA